MNLEAVLVDDDILVRIAWQQAAREAGVSFRSFAGVEEFFQYFGELKLDVKIYLDSDLRSVCSGQELAYFLYYQCGYRRIYLATGRSKATLAPMPWIVEILGKDPPFLS